MIKKHRAEIPPTLRLGKPIGPLRRSESEASETGFFEPACAGRRGHKRREKNI